VKYRSRLKDKVETMLKNTIAVIAATISFSTCAQAAELQPFSAIYETNYGLLSARGERKLEPLADGQWKVQSNAHVMAFDLNENATFTPQNARLRPLKYNFENPFNKSRSMKLAFDWEKNSVFNDIEKVTVPLAANAYDKLSYQVQLQLNVCANPDKYAGEDFQLVDRNKLKTYHVELVGREKLKTEVGTLNTIKLRQFRPDKRDGKDTQIWLAADWSCILVRLDQYDKDDLYTLKFISAKINGKEVTGK
jgi:hypothetical protein